MGLSEVKAYFLNRDNYVNMRLLLTHSVQHISEIFLGQFFKIRYKTLQKLTKMCKQKTQK